MSNVGSEKGIEALSNQSPDHSSSRRSGQQSTAVQFSTSSPADLFNYFASYTSVTSDLALFPLGHRWLSKAGGHKAILHNTHWCMEGLSCTSVIRVLYDFSVTSL